MTETPVRPADFSMTDEEGDLLEYQAYLRAVEPDALWDVLSHLDEDRYPRRREAVLREIARRRLFFVSPYTAFETAVRWLSWGMVVASLFAAVTHIIPIVAGLVSRASEQFGGAVPSLTGRPVALISGFTSGELRLLAGLTTLFRGFAIAEAVILFGYLPVCAIRLVKRRLRTDVLVTAVVSLMIACLFLRLAYLAL